MRQTSWTRALAPALLLAVAALSAPAAAQAPAQPALNRDEITALAKVHVAIRQVSDSIDARLAQAKNKTPQAQQQLRDERRQTVAAILQRNGLDEQEFQRKTYLVSTDGELRKLFDATVAQLTGTPLPGQVQAAPAVAVPVGIVGTHIGHVVNAFSDTPGGMGLLPAAFAEARIATQHAGLAGRQPGNLDYMKTHVGHVLHALDPTVVSAGPGRGYGLKKAVLGVVTHIELAAQATGASDNVKTHATHAATAARSVAERADQIIVLGRQVQAAASAEAAASLVNQIASLCDQLLAGADANGDGRITWEKGEGGLQQAQEHVNLLLAGERRP